VRAADAAEKASAHIDHLLSPYKAPLLVLMEETTEIELRWHLAQMVPRLNLTSRQRQRVLSVMQSYLSDPSSIVRTFAIEAQADLVERDDWLRPAVVDTLRRARKTGMRARARKLLTKLETA
jgi:hypothetical protein